MPTYTYTCPGCGPFDLVRSIACRTDAAHCPACDQPGSRVFSSPHLSQLNAAHDRAVTNAGLSSETPQVTRHVPAAAQPTPRITQRPGFPALPRP